MVWGMAGKGLRTTISLEGFYDKVLAKFALDCNKICGINLVIPIGTIAFFALLAFGIVWILEKLADARQGQEGRWRI